MKYEMAVITPFHNVDMDLFKECEAAMRRQSIGFGKIQWIIVLHNCDPQYMPLLKEIFRDDTNVVLEELNNDFRTPSSPRNRGIELIDARYTGFLDADDCYTDDCISEVLKNAEETRADMVNVRREPVLTSDELRRVTVRMLFNNTERRTIMENGHWNTDLMFGYSWGISTSYFFRSSLLKENGITYDKSVLFAEDFLFVLHAIAHANRVCYLNQFIGYRYVINEGSLVQSQVKPAATLLTYAEGYSTIFDTMTRYGIDSSVTVVWHLAILSNFILHCKDMTIAVRRGIKELLGDRLTSLQSLIPNKLMSREQLADAVHLACDVILNPEKDMSTLLSNELDGLYDLRKLLLANAGTDIARRNDFKTITTLEAWQFRMPLTDARFYRPLIDLQTRVGENMILTAAPTIMYFRKREGELVPCTKEHITAYGKAVNTELKGKRNILLVRSLPITEHTNDNAVVDTLESALVKAYFRHHYMEDGIVDTRFAATPESYFASGEDAWKSIVEQSLAYEDAEQITAFTCDNIAMFFRYIEDNWRQLVASVPCNETRRAELEHIFGEGFGKPVARRIWKKLQRIVAFGSGEHYPAFEEMKKYTGDVPHNHGYYFTEEAILGRATEDDSQLFECIKNDYFYELIPLASDSAPVCWTDVEKGSPYQVVVTNRAGLYRYVTDHFICPQEITAESIKFTIY